MPKKIIFLDRDGTLIDEPEDKQIDHIAKFKLKNQVIPALLSLKNAGFRLVMITNQDGLGSEAYPQEIFDTLQTLLIDILKTQGILLDEILICPHFEIDYCDCRKPKVGLLLDYLKENSMDFTNSYVIGDRESDLLLAKNMGIVGILIDDKKDWLTIAREITEKPRNAKITRETMETEIALSLDLDRSEHYDIQTGIGFFDHMLHQLAKHGGFELSLKVKGDLFIDEHHTIEDTAIVLGSAIKKALGDKRGIQRYGFLLPMDEARTQVALDLSGRHYFEFQGQFPRENIGNFPTELVSHFFRSLSEGLSATLHIKVSGENTHHMIESIFKGVGRALRQAIHKNHSELPTTKGVL